MSNSCSLLVIRASKLLIPLSCWGIIVRDSVFRLKKKKAQSMCCNSSTGTRPPDLFAFLYHLFKPASHLLPSFTCSTSPHFLGKEGSGKYSLKTVLIGADLITRSQRPAQ